eukprot:CAMPEP_0198122306 /NCGR_PEP_ID=MMETSP1442-20131203/34426_1 /TAXON_ID= /ORGANISM="Craspedostauros australis, Strain CCMP3328" /LENGTH=169 /DNA_ID=CAMNT_0043781299 /DNA_START=191 /DNA_END=699 /DNA_ORIENTATION=+
MRTANPARRLVTRDAMLSCCPDMALDLRAVVGREVGRELGMADGISVPDVVGAMRWDFAWLEAGDAGWGRAWISGDRRTVDSVERAESVHDIVVLLAFSVGRLAWAYRVILAQRAVLRQSEGGHAGRQTRSLGWSFGDGIARRCCAPNARIELIGTLPGFGINVVLANS